MWTENSKPNEETLAVHLADTVASQLEQLLAKQNSAVLVVSGGSTPMRFFELLSEADLDWGRVTVTLADERWVDEEHEDSNQKLVRDHLIQNKAAHAYFLGLKNSALKPSEGIVECETNFRTQQIEPDLVVLGMGNDGHTLSWFPGAENLSNMMDENSGAWCLPVEDDFLPISRMTLTWRFLKKAKKIYLHFHGQEKYSVFSKAAEKLNGHLPVSFILQQNSVPVSVYCTREEEVK